MARKPEYYRNLFLPSLWACKPLPDATLDIDHVLWGLRLKQGDFEQFIPVDDDEKKTIDRVVSAIKMLKTQDDRWNES